MKRRALVVSHADADGHVIAEQVRRNLAQVPSFEVSTLIDPVRTKDHKAWLTLESIGGEIEHSELVFFVDLMFAPASFGAEADALVRFATDRPEKRFFVLDHHPLPLRRLSSARNLRATYREDVLDCTFGPWSPMMIIAALCEKQATRAKALQKPIDVDIAKGVKRAAALGGSLPGAKLSALLCHGCWSDLARLGREPKDKHRLPRGLRPAGGPASTILAELDATATRLIESAQTSAKGTPMSYDFESATDRSPPVVTSYVPHAKDLEAIVTVLQLAAIELTPTAGALFTVTELLAQVRELAGDEINIDESDVRIVLDKSGFLKKEGTKLRLK
jgi:hypothetical protein